MPCGSRSQSDNRNTQAQAKTPIRSLPLLSAQRSAFTQSSRSPQSSARGFTLIELIIVITLIVILMGLFMNRFMFYQEQAEKVAMEGVVGAIQSSLTLQYGQIQTRGNPTDVPALAEDNPMNWLQKKPNNYAGEFYELTPLSARSGNWVFDLKTRELVYLVRNGDHFKPGLDGKNWIRFRVATRYEQSRLPSQQNAAPQLTGLLFEPVEPYSWL
jgi:general secretion pathway protein G